MQCAIIREVLWIGHGTSTRAKHWHSFPLEVPYMLLKARLLVVGTCHMFKEQGGLRLGSGSALCANEERLAL